MAAYTKVLLSGTSNGSPIQIADNSPTGTTGTLVHTAPTGTTSRDEVWLWAANETAAAMAVYVKAGGTANQNRIPVMIRPSFSRLGWTQILPGMILNSAGAIRISATATTGLKVIGYANRITD